MGMAEDISQYLTKKSRPDSDHPLEEPSHMKSDGVDAWLGHWLKMQKRHKRPLQLKGIPDDNSSNPTTASKPKAKKKTAQETEGNKSDGAEPNEGDTGKGSDGVGPDRNETSDAIILPPTPLSASETRKTRRTFLASLSNDKNYKKFIMLLGAAKVCNILSILRKLTSLQDGDFLEGNPPAWVSWESDVNYLSDDFYKKESSSSLSALMRWITLDPITADGDVLASYKQVELVILGVGLALRGLWVAQFPEKYADVPTYIDNSPYPFSQYEQLGHIIQDLIVGYAETWVLLLIAYFDL
jgi:hypothetical protein